MHAYVYAYVYVYVCMCMYMSYVCGPTRRGCTLVWFCISLRLEARAYNNYSEITVGGAEVGPIVGFLEIL